eukprot:CAMPEP_0181069742 /NCGR_PEP_ID=MMETSP1070-20121207/27114_1 /TAXON_ID=265543 /ORGANISM="Minutocellus polymorphus, Strain NH13" /LENGTH=733 /DNA_ID=CAMNT_0023150579 /DNA_START=104 /DNA_END=2305 /DNA_ORIENTATION=-
MGLPSGCPGDAGQNAKAAAAAGDVGEIGSAGTGDESLASSAVQEQQSAAAISRTSSRSSSADDPAQVAQPQPANGGNDDTDTDNDNENDTDNDSTDNSPTPSTPSATEDVVRFLGSLEGRLPHGAWHVEGFAARERRQRNQTTTPTAAAGLLRVEHAQHSADSSSLYSAEGGGITTVVTAMTTMHGPHEAVVTDAIAIPVDDPDEEEEEEADNGTAVVSAVMDSEAIAQHEERLVEQVREETKRELTTHKRKTWLFVGALLLIVVIVISVSVSTLSGNRTADSTGPDGLGGVGPGISNDCSRFKIVPDRVKQGDEFGYAIDMSGDMMLVGAAMDSTLGEESGAAYIFRRNQDDNTTWLEEAKIYPEDGAHGDKFGVKLALNDAGDVAAISADQVDFGKGAIYVYTRSVSNQGPENRPTTIWMLQAKLVADDATEAAQFGDSVDIQGDTIVVGAPHPSQPGTSGAVYVFEKDGGSSSWVQMDKLVPSGDNANSIAESIRFGRSVALAGNTLVVGADKDGPNGPFSGSAYIFRKTEDPRSNKGQTRWVEEAKLYPDDGGEAQYFGYDVDIDANGVTVVISSWKDGAVTKPATEEKATKTEQIGAVYTFTRADDLGGNGEGSWRQQAKITAEDRELGDRFGNSVSINDEGDTLLVGAYHDDERRGSAYLFRRGVGGDAASWMQTMKLRADDVNAVEEFAFQVVLDGTGAAISEVKDVDNGYEAGAAHVYDIDKCIS